MLQNFIVALDSKQIVKDLEEGATKYMEISLVRLIGGLKCLIVLFPLKAETLIATLIG